MTKLEKLYSFIASQRAWHLVNVCYLYGLTNEQIRIVEGNN